jgi:hypothetical protein
MRAMYLRLVYAKPPKESRCRLGIVRNRTASCGSEELDEFYMWLKIHLPVPPEDVFSAGRGLCWFKLEARECIEKVRDLARWLEKRRGERIWQVYSRNPGLITYEDEFQVVAIPDSARMTARAPRG